MILNILFVGVGGFLGSILRYLITKSIHHFLGYSFPYGTFVVNLIGSLLLGFFLANFRQSLIPEYWQLFITTGIMGALTTFSTFSVETLVLMQQGDWFKAIANLGLNIVLCLIGSSIGMLLVRYGLTLKL